MPLFSKRLVLLYVTCLLIVLVAASVHADPYDNMWMECHYITQCSMSGANATVKDSDVSSPGFGAINDWRIGNGAADSVDCGTQAVGMVGLLYGYKHLSEANRSNSELDAKVRTACQAFFLDWMTNPANQIHDNDETGYPSSAAYSGDGKVTSMGGGSAGVTAQLLIAMSKYWQLSPDGNGSLYEEAKYPLALAMGRYVAHHLTSWTIERSYAASAFRSLSHWSAAVGDSANARLYAAQAVSMSDELLAAQDKGLQKNYFDYISYHGNGIYGGGNVDQTGFAPYEFDARSPTEPFAQDVIDWWDHGQTPGGNYMTVQSGPYAGGVHQVVPKYADRCYPGDPFQLVDAEWKVAQSSKQKKRLISEAWKHYNFALSPLGSKDGSGCWTNVTSVDTCIGGFVDWVDLKGNRPADWQRYVDTSAYMIVATEELVFNREVDWSK